MLLHMFIHLNAGRLIGAGSLAAGVSSAQDLLSASASVEAAIAAAGAFVVLAGAGATIYGWVGYKGLLGLRNEMDRAFTDIEALLHQRFDALPALASVCTPYLQDESRFLLLAVGRSRSEWAIAQDNEDRWKVWVESRLALKQLFAATESHPELRAKESFARLLETLKGIEKKISIRREQYNAAAGSYNARIKQFPNSWIANFADFKSRRLLAAPAENIDTRSN
jgi:LemA protein